MKKRGYQYLCAAFAVFFLVAQGCGRYGEPAADTNSYFQTGEAEAAGGAEQETTENQTASTEGEKLVQDAPEAAATSLEDETATEEEESLASVSRDKYAYQMLSEEEQKVYDQIYHALMGHAEQVTVDTLDKDLLEHAYRSVQADYGGMFWVNGYSYTTYTIGEELISIDFKPTYTMTVEERAGIQERINEAVGQILLGIDLEASDYEKAKYVFDYLASAVAYREDAPDNQNIISVFLNHETVCQGYASAMQYLFNQLGIQSVIVTGTANGEPHAWNVVRLDGAYYHMDATWGNSTYTGSDGDFGRYINYSYFAVTSEEIEKTHEADDTVLLPECNATADNYYVREGRYISEWDPDAVGALLRETYEKENMGISLKFASEELYQRGKTYFIEQQHIADYCSGITELQYMEENEQWILTLKF